MQDWNRGERGDSMRSGSGRSLTSLGSKGDTNSVAESTSSAMEVGKEAKEKKDKSSWVKTIGMRTLRLRKNKDSDKTQSRLSISSALGSLDRPGKSKNKKDKHGKGDDQQPQISGSSSSTTVGASHSNKPGEHVKDNDSIYSGASSKNGSTTRDIVGGSTSTNVAATAGENQGTTPCFLLSDSLFTYIPLYCNHFFLDISENPNVLQKTQSELNFGEMSSSATCFLYHLTIYYFLYLPSSHPLYPESQSIFSFNILYALLYIENSFVFMY